MYAAMPFNNQFAGLGFAVSEETIEEDYELPFWSI